MPNVGIVNLPNAMDNILDQEPCAGRSFNAVVPNTRVDVIALMKRHEWCWAIEGNGGIIAE